MWCAGSERDCTSTYDRIESGSSSSNTSAPSPDMASSAVEKSSWEPVYLRMPQSANGDRTRGPQVPERPFGDSRMYRPQTVHCTCTYTPTTREAIPLTRRRVSRQRDSSLGDKLACVGSCLRASRRITPCKQSGQKYCARTVLGTLEYCAILVLKTLPTTVRSLRSRGLVCVRNVVPEITKCEVAGYCAWCTSTVRVQYEYSSEKRSL